MLETRHENDRYHISWFGVGLLVGWRPFVSAAGVSCSLFTPLKQHAHTRGHASTNVMERIFRGDTVRLMIPSVGMDEGGMTHTGGNECSIVRHISLSTPYILSKVLEPLIARQPGLQAIPSAAQGPT